MRARLAFIAALTALITSQAAPAPAGERAAWEPYHEAVETQPIGSVPYVFDCTITTLDNGTETTRRKLMEGELGNEPVFFAVDHAEIHEPGRSMQRRHRCTIEIGRDIDVSSVRLSSLPAVAQIAFGGHAHTMRRSDKPEAQVMSARVMRPTLILPGRRLSLEWGSGTSTVTDGYIHDAGCQGLALQRLPAPEDAWAGCAHEEPGEFWRDPPRAS